MSLADFWQRWQARRHERAVQRHRKHIKNRFGFGEDRKRAVEFFRALGGLEGCRGLLERFMVNIDHTIRDEEEKQEVFGIIQGFGAEAVPAIEEYLNRRDATRVPVTWPLRLLAAVAPPEQAVSVIIGTLEKLGTSYTTDPERKVLLVSQLAEYDDPRVVPTLISFLRDHRDEVQVEALGALVRRADERAREPMLDLLTDDETPLRIRAAVADALQKLDWDVKGFRKRVEEVLPEGLHLDRAGRIRGRWAGASGDVTDEAG
ncbi:MAG: HEAT repeat domain-containing protein [Myxococcales bacterium]|nr:HEAT repeat domain-containing protein [Myxococcales bacterium]